VTPRDAQEDRMDQRLTIVGTGKLGEALVAGLLGAGGIAPDQVTCTARREERRAELAATYGVQATLDNASAVAGADVVVLGLKPQVLLDVLAGLAGSFRPDQTVISLAAGVTTTAIERVLGVGVPVVRVMTNTPLHVGAAMSVLASGRYATDADLARAEAVLEPVGRVLVLPEERLDAVTALSGSGPAYLFYLAEALVAAGVEQGLDRVVAAELTVQTLAGAAELLRVSGTQPEELRAAVTSPGGTTAAAVAVLDHARVPDAVARAVAAARHRAEELAAS